MKTTEIDIDVFIKLLVLLYADDTVLLGIDAESFQHNLHAFYEYLQQWQLKVIAKLKLSYLESEIHLIILSNLGIIILTSVTNSNISELYSQNTEAFIRQLNTILTTQEKHSNYNTKELIICISL